MKIKEMAEKIREELDNCKRPLFFFDGDADGLSAFLLLYKYVREGRGIVVKTRPLDMKSFPRVEEYDPDKVFILDVALIDQEFINAIKRPVIVIDHHNIQNLERVKEFNVKMDDPKNVMSTSYLCYEAVQQDLWLALTGSIGDWFLPSYSKEFSKEHPDLLPKDVKTGEEALFESKMGGLSHMFWFLLKGKTSDAMKCVKILTRIEDPKEILEQSTAAGKFIYKKFEKIDKKYKELLSDFKKRAEIGDKMVIFRYKEGQIGFSASLSNKMVHKYPKKLILIAREKQEEVVCSLRSKLIDLPKLINKALVGVNGIGGGHKQTVGVRVKIEDFDRFIENIQKEI